MLLSPEIITILVLDFIFLFFGTIAFVISIRIVRYWDMNSTKPIQYKLEKQSFLVSTIIKYIFIVKLPLFLFFIYTADKLSDIIIGAMCAAGVVSSVPFSEAMFFFKILNLYIFGFWLVLNRFDLKKENQPYTKLKFWLYIVGYILLLVEIYYEIDFFLSLDVGKLVSCCSTIFSAATKSSFSFIYSINKLYLVYAFYGVFLFSILAYILKNSIAILLCNVSFIFIAIVSLIMFFGTYIYQLPHHHCPFCVLKKDYYYIGYVLYVTLYIGTFYGISGAIMSMLEKKKEKFYYNISMIFNTIYTLIVSAYPIVYFMKNGVWL